MLSIRKSKRLAGCADAEHLPGFARVSGGRCDIRFAMDSEGELYIMSKSDGMIRAIVGATAK
jgi:hypothetical protein